MTICGIPNKYFVAAVMIGIVISIVISMIFGMVLTYVPTVDTMPKIIEPVITPVPVVTNDMSYSSQLQFKNISSQMLFPIKMMLGEDVTFIIFLMMILVLIFMLSSNHNITMFIPLALCGIMWWLYPQFLFLSLGCIAILILYLLSMLTRGDCV